MTLDELKATVAAHGREDWHVIAEPMNHRGARDEEVHTRAVLVENIDVGMAWGFDEDISYREPWLDAFGKGSKAQRLFADLLYRGQPVFRFPYLSVDGARGTVPYPSTDRASGQRWVTSWQATMARLIGALNREDPFYGDHIAQAGFVVRDD